MASASRRSIVSEIKPIRSEADYDVALAEVERLWGARSGTPEGDRLDVLATLIDAYESEHDSIDPPDPIEAIKFRMEQQGLTRMEVVWEDDQGRQHTIRVGQGGPSPSIAVFTKAWVQRNLDEFLDGDTAS